MIQIRIASEINTEVLALLGRITYAESHGRFIENKKDLLNYTKTAFSVSKIKQELNAINNVFYIIYVDDLPVGYAKLVLNESNINVNSNKSCLLERIYILADFIPLKIGYQFLTFLEEKAKAEDMDTMWLTVYIENEKAIRFYQRNDYKKVGETMFLVNEKEYDNMVLSKTI